MTNNNRQKVEDNQNKTQPKRERQTEKGRQKESGRPKVAAIRGFQPKSYRQKEAEIKRAKMRQPKRSRRPKQGS